MKAARVDAPARLGHPGSCRDLPAVGLASAAGLLEHEAVLRHWGRLQRQMDDVLGVALAREAALTGENLRLRAELVLLRTRVLWGMGHAQMHRSPRHSRVVQPLLEPGSREAQAVICQTGCVGHAHPWLEADGQCRRSGRACEPLAAGVGATPGGDEAKTGQA